MRTKTIPLFPAMILAAWPAGAAPSLCSHLPTAGKVTAAAPDDVQPARPLPNRNLRCPPGFRLDITARPPSCRRAGQGAADGNPRAACLARLPLGPVADIVAQYRPTRSCPSGPISSLIRLEGHNAGLADVALSSRSPGVTLESLDEDSAGLAAEQRPSAQGCFADACRLVRLTVAADAGDTARLELAIAGGEQQVVTVPLISHCEDSLARRPGVGLRRTTAAPPGG